MTKDKLQQITPAMRAVSVNLPLDIALRAIWAIQGELDDDETAAVALALMDALDTVPGLKSDEVDAIVATCTRDFVSEPMQPTRKH